MRRHACHLAALVIAAGVATAVATPLQDFSDVTIETIRVAEGVYMLEGAGGNIGLSVGESGAFLIDDQFAPLTEKITAAVAKVSDQPVRFVVNTHWHFDHTGGNENLGNAGVIIVAHENVRARMSSEQFIEAFGRRQPPSPDAALPVITFTDAMTFHWNGDQLHVFHFEHAHTDGDAIIHFRGANVVHMGDIFFNEMYPFIDVSSGGRVDGMIAAVDHVLAMVDERTKIIPGHGPLTDAAGLRTYRGMLDTVRGRLRSMIDAGRSRDEVIAAKPTADLDEHWGGGFMKPDQWVGIVYDSMTTAPARQRP